MEPSFWSTVVVPEQSILVDLAAPSQEIHLTNIVLDTSSKHVKSVTLRAHTDRVPNGSIIALLRPCRTDNLTDNLTFFPSDKFLKLSIENITTGPEDAGKRSSVAVHISGASSPYQVLTTSSSSSLPSLALTIIVSLRTTICTEAANCIQQWYFNILGVVCDAVLSERGQWEHHV